MNAAGVAAGGALRQVLTLLGGSSIAQAIALAASLVLTRLYTPEQFGTFALFASVVTLLSTGATGRYELAVLLPASDDEAWQVAWLALLIALPVVVLTLAAVAVWGDALAARAGDLRLGVWAWLLPLAVWLTAVVNTLTCWANRCQAFRGLAINRIAQTGITSVASIGLGVIGWASPGLMLGSVLGQATGAALLVGGGPRPAVRGVDVPRLSALASRYRDFPRINLPHAVLDALQASVVLCLLGAVYGAAALGGYAFALRVARAPLAMLGASIGAVFQQRAARLVSTQCDLADLARRTVRRLAVFAVPVFLVLMCAPDLFAWLFGAEWRAAGEQARVLAPWMVLNFMTSPLSQLPLIVGRQGRAFGFGIAYQLAMVVPVAIGWALDWPLLHALAAQSALTSGVLLVYGRWLLQLSRGAV
jgi:O-antigen/teichoic acid export membrane protein